jgi:outer membrane lipoprotein-sorting protein
MKRSRIGIWAVAALLIGPAIHAEEPVSEQKLTESLKLYAAISTLDVDFKQTKTLKDLDLILKSEGKLRLERPDRVTWEIIKPSPLVVVLDKKEIRIRTGKGSEAQTETLKMDDGSDSATRSLSGLIAWLTLDSKALVKQYRVYSVGKEAFRFEPREKNAVPFENIEMSLRADGQLSRLKIHELSGDALDIEFGRPKLTRSRD